MDKYEYLRPYAYIDRHHEVLDALEQSSSVRKAAELLDIDSSNFRRYIRKMKRRAELQGLSPEHDMTKAAPDTYMVKGTSTLYDEDGQVKIQWVKTDVDKEARLKAIIDAIQEYAENLPLIPAIAAPAETKQNLLTLYTLTDYHLGMYSWQEETGDDWDVDIAERVMVNAISDMITGSPDSETAILNIQGDFMHWDGLDAVTPTSKHIVDADTRFAKLAMLSLDVITKAVGMLLQKHARVRVIVCEGNHDIVSSAWLQISLNREYRNNDRVDVDMTHFPFYAHLHGEIMLGFHHGHKVKNGSLPALFASEPRYREMWGNAKYTYIHTGHYHHTEQNMAEGGGAIVERHPTLAARDAYAARGGYVSWRAARAITYDAKAGEVHRVTVIPREN